MAEALERAQGCTGCSGRGIFMVIHFMDINGYEWGILMGFSRDLMILMDVTGD
jgi:hypothetical protein